MPLQILSRHFEIGTRRPAMQSRDTVEAWVADSLRECAEHGQKFGVIVAVQNHGDFLNTGADHASLIERVNHNWCAASC